MEREVIEAWEKAKPSIKAWLTVNHPKDEEQLIRRMFFEMKQFGLQVDVDDITRVDNKHTWSLMFTIPIDDIFTQKGKFTKRPFYSIVLSYGSHPATDMLLYIQQDKKNRPTKQQIKDYMLMALHIVQNTSAQKELKNIFWDRLD